MALCWMSRDDIPRMISMLIFGVSMIELYTVSAIYHIGNWPASQRRVLRTIDHANIFILIAGTYTPLCFNVLSGWFRIVMLLLIWLLAILGVCLSFFTLKLPRWLLAALYVGMGWVAILALPVFITKLPWIALATLALGGILYTIGAVIYARKKPDPFPNILGYHEVAACNARSTSQNGNSVPIASVPRAAKPRAIHVVQPAFARLCSTVVSTATVVLGVVFTATAVAVPAPLSLDLVEMRLPA